MRYIFIDDLLKLINNCLSHDGYKATIYIDNRWAIGTLKEWFVAIASSSSFLSHRFVSNRDRLEIQFGNGSCIRVIIPSEYARGYRNHGVLIEERIDTNTTRALVLSTLRSYQFHARDNNGHILIEFDLLPERYCFDFNELTCAQLTIFKRRLEEMVTEKLLTGSGIIGAYELKPMPFYEKEYNNKKVLMYDVCGFNDDNLTYEAKFTNKTKSMALNFVGKAIIGENTVDGSYEEEKEFKLNIPINTNLYDKYNVIIKDGVLIVELFEIINEVPKFEKIGC